MRTNLALWERESEGYERRCAKSLGGRRAMAWGLWRVPESELRLLGEIRGRDVLEVGCGAARWAIALARAGSRPVGLDFSPRHLRYAARLVRRARAQVPLVRANAERLPFEGESFDVVFCDWGALTFCDPYRSVPEASRVLRPGGRLVFATSSPFRAVAQNRRTDHTGPRLLYDYFGLHRLNYSNEVNFTLPYGEWIRLFRENDLEIERLVETRPRASDRSPYLNRQEAKWTRRWPYESIWSVRKSSRVP